MLKWPKLTNIQNGIFIKMNKTPLLCKIMNNGIFRILLKITENRAMLALVYDSSVVYLSNSCIFSTLIISFTCENIPIYRVKTYTVKVPLEIFYLE